MIASTFIFTLFLVLGYLGTIQAGGCNEAYTGRKGAGYRGCQTETLSGYTCQPWHRQSPHSHTRTPKNYRYSGLDSNYCRNPDGAATIWCYTMSGGMRWDYCAPKTIEC